ncbi:MAG: hypothetical protein HYY34_06675 [Chloroflexi bacterium]|nr:hypothetical protein [Chloroflexota bacterium]
MPRINLLPSGGAVVDRRTLIRGALVAIILIEVVYLLIQYQGKGADEAAAELARTGLQDVQKQVATEQAAVDELQGKVDEARKRVEAARLGYEQVAGGQTNWYSGSSAVLEARIEGIEFVSIIARPGGEIALNGTATDLGTMSRFQGRLREQSQRVRLQSISFETSSSALRFKAILKVAR